MFKQKYSHYLVSVMLLMMSAKAISQAKENVTLLYFERPPYYYTEKGPKGLLLGPTVNLMQKSILDLSTRSTSSKAILNVIKENNGAFCSVGWFKTKERESYGKFTKSIYTNKPIKLLTLKKHSSLFKKEMELEEIFKQKSLKWGALQAFKYGDNVEILAKNHNMKRVYGRRQDLLVNMMVYERFHYILIAPEEIDYIIKGSGHDKNLFLTVNLSNIQKGNDRYIICSKKVSDQAINEFNKYVKIP